MRDIIVTLIVFGTLPYILRRPYIGILVWSWLSYMNPHRLTWGFAYDMPFAQIVAITLLVSLLISKETKMVPVNAITIIWIIFIIWMGITTLFAYFPVDAMEQYKKVLKIQFVVFLTMMVMTDMERIKKIIWIIVLSIGYYSVKGGLFTILKGGTQRVWGPTGSFIEDNNALAVAVLMIIPFIFYLYQIQSRRWVKLGLLIAGLLSFVSALGSQSRGAFLACAAVGLFFWLKSQKKVFIGICITFITFVLLSFMSESWQKRMETMQNYQEDSSAMGRINAWYYAFNAANDNLFGVGFESWNFSTFALYAPNPIDVHAAHSIYFSVLADHGWIGLFFFMLILFLTWRLLSKIIKSTKNQESLREINLLARMMQVSFIAYLVGGAFLSLSYFDLPWHLVSFVVLLNEIVKKQNLSDRIVRNERAGPIIQKNFLIQKS